MSEKENSRATKPAKPKTPAKSPTQTLKGLSNIRRFFTKMKNLFTSSVQLISIY